ncbi:ComEC/Rec2 family competence protein [Haloferula sargassicola]|uniref:ComE operon protein 3 n=1 Tax=Haloferula sargassicola TaxID=490096 RepID=A0ABP9UN04_9BACT
MKRRLRQQVERRPLLWLAGIALAAVLGVDGKVWTGLLVGLPLVAAAVASGIRRVWVAGLLLATVAGWLHAQSLAARGEAETWAGWTGVGRFEVLESPRRRGAEGWSALGRFAETGWRVWLEGSGPVPGKRAVVEGAGRFERPEGPRNPGGFDRRPWLARQDVAVVFRFSGPPSRLRPPPAWSGWGIRVKKGFREAVTRGLAPDSEEAMVIRAVVLGEHPENDLLIQPFRNTGTLHVFAVSGLHVGMVGLIGWAVLRLLGVPHRKALVPLLVLIFGYAWLTGLKPPAVRAAWMAALVLGAFALRRRPDAGNALGFAAVLVLVVNADLVFTAGVQLSFGVVLAILLLHQRVAERLAWMTREEPYLPRVLYGPLRESWLRTRRVLADGLGVSSAAWLGSAPLTAVHFGILTPISVVASLWLTGVVFPLLGLALFSAAGWWIPGWSATINHLNGRLADVALGSARAGARVPGGHFPVARGRPAPEFLWVFDVGGDGAACWSGKDGAVLIDGASRYRFEDQVLPALRQMAVRPESIVATHPDGRHIGGLIDAVDAFEVRQAMVPVERALGSTYRDWLAVCADRGVRMVAGRTGERYPLGDETWLEVVGEPDWRDWHRVADDRVMPVKLHWRGWRILFVADQGWGGEHALMAGGSDLSADLIVAGRHSYDNSLGDDFLNATGARVVIASHEGFPASERIPEGWRKACEARGIAVFHQGETGAVSVVADDHRLVVRAFLGGREISLQR